VNDQLAELDVPFRALCSGDASARPPSGVWVARAKHEWQRSWEQLDGHRQPPRTAPLVDWNTDVVIVFALGVRGSGGFAASIERLRIMGETMRVFVCERQPGPSRITTAALTNPYVAVTTARRDLPVQMVRRVEILDSPLP
jgi:hypothetical protein